MHCVHCAYYTTLVQLIKAEVNFQFKSDFTHAAWIIPVTIKVKNYLFLSHKYKNFKKRNKTKTESYSSSLSVRLKKAQLICTWSVIKRPSWPTGLDADDRTVCSNRRFVQIGYNRSQLKTLTYLTPSIVEALRIENSVLVYSNSLCRWCQRCQGSLIDSRYFRTVHVGLFQITWSK